MFNKTENNFIKTFNQKTTNELTLLQKTFIKELFPNIDYTDKIIAWKNYETKKADIFIKVNTLTRGISIKSGNENSMHSEHIKEFVKFLNEINITNDKIRIYKNYHYGEFGDGKKYSAKELKEKMKNQLQELNKELNKPKNIIKAVERYVIHGIDTKYDIAALVSGTPENFTWIKSENIYDFALNYDKSKYEAPHFGMLILQPKKRDLENTGKNYLDCHRVQVKWHNLYEEIIEYYHKK